MLIDNDIMTYNSFESLDKEKIYSLERVSTDGATTKLRSHQAKRVHDTRKCISFFEENEDRAIVADPTKWVKINFERWKRKGKPARPNDTPPDGAGIAVPTTVTTTAKKQQKIDDNKLQTWSRGTKSAKDYSLLENNEFYTKQRIKMVQQIQLDGWERLIDNTFDSKLLRPSSDKDLYSLQAVFMYFVFEKVL